MSRSLNKVILIGNLGAIPRCAAPPTAPGSRHFQLATSRQWNGQGGDKQEKTEWHRSRRCGTTVRRGTGLADIAEKYCKKGDKVYVEGRIEYRSWQDREGQTRYTTEIIASELILLGGRQGGAGAESAPAKSGGDRRRGRPEEGREGRLRGLPRGAGRRGRRPPVLGVCRPPVGSPGGWLPPSRKARRSRHAAKDLPPAKPPAPLFWHVG